MSKRHTETVDSKLKTCWHVVSRMYNAEASLHDLTIAMGHFLLNIDSHEGSYGSGISPLLRMERNFPSRITLSLEKKRLIQRIPDVNDGRKIKIVLTAKGKSAKELA